MNDLSEISPKAGGFTGLLRVTALIAAVIGAVGAEVFTLRAGQSSPRLLLVLFII